MKTGLKNESIGFLCDTGHVKASLKNTEGETNVEIRPFVFDARVKGIHADKISDVEASILGKTKKHDESRLYATGPSIPDSVNTALDGLPLSINLYVSESKAFIDLSSSGVLRTAISNALIEEYPDYPGIMPRSHKKLDEYEEIEKYMPVDAKLEEYATTLHDELVKSYNKAPSSFSFSQDDETSTIVFQTDSWSTLRALLDREQLENSSIDISSFFDEAESKATINRCRIDVKYSATALLSLGMDIAFTFKEAEVTESLAPCGTWELSGVIEVSHGEAATPIAISDSVDRKSVV